MESCWKFRFGGDVSYCKCGETVHCIGEKVKGLECKDVEIAH